MAVLRRESWGQWWRFPRPLLRHSLDRALALCVPVNVCAGWAPLLEPALQASLCVIPAGDMYQVQQTAAAAAQQRAAVVVLAAASKPVLVVSYQVVEYVL